MVLVKNWQFFYIFNIGKISLVICISPSGKHISLVICVALPKKHISQGAFPWDEVGFWFKNGHFSNFFFSGNIGQENVFYDILERKNPFLGDKEKKFKKSKN